MEKTKKVLKVVGIVVAATVALCGVIRGAVTVVPKIRDRKVYEIHVQEDVGF